MNLRSVCFVYKHYISIHIKGVMQYKTSFFLSVLGTFLVSFNVFLGIHVMFLRFNSIEGFTYSQVLLCYAIFLMGFSLAECVARGFDTFSSIVRHGEFDRILLRPRSPILQVLGSRFELNRIGRMLQAAAMFYMGIWRSRVIWTPDKILTVIFMILGGMALFSGIFLIYAALCFFTLEGLEFMNVFTDGAREFGKYPIEVYGKRFLRFCTFLVPYALVQYYPLRYLLGEVHEPVWIFLPLAAFGFLVPSYLLWRLGVRKYQSAGS